MNDTENSYCGYIKYEGPLVENGYMDARESADVLVGIDGIIRYFLYKVNPEIQDIDFGIPVKIQKGSWEALIPDSIQDWIITAGGLGLTNYITTAFGKMAENDVDKIGFKELIKGVFKSIKWVIRVAKHIGSFKVKTFNDVQYKEINGENFIGISNKEGEILFVPIKYLEIYRDCPEKLFSDIAKNIDEGRELEIGLNPNEPLDNDDTETKVKITFNEKYIFTKKENDGDFLFPDLIHGAYVELEGHITRGNENSNSIGFEYLRHILTCYPINGNVKNYKNLLFTNCKIKGYVDRHDENGEILERRPKINFIELEEIQTTSGQLGLFNG